MVASAAIAAGVVCFWHTRATAYAEQATRCLHSWILPVRWPRVWQHTRRSGRPRGHARRQTSRGPYQRESHAAAQLPASRVVERYSGEWSACASVRPAHADVSRETGSTLVTGDS